MSTPKIERVVSELLKEAINDFDMAKASAGREVSFSYWFKDEVTKAMTTLLTTHDAELKEKIEGKKMDTKDIDGNPLAQYANRERMGYNQALSDVQTLLTTKK